MKPLFIACFCSLAWNAQALDNNSNQQSDIWEIHYGALNLPAIGDADHDGFSNALESVAGTNPLDPTSYPKTELAPGLAGEVNVIWPSEAGKSYGIYGSPDLNPANFTLLGTVMGDGASILESLATNGQSRWFFKLDALDVDSDTDGLTNWEEIKFGFDPYNSQSNRLGNDGLNTPITDLQQLNASWAAASTVTVGLVDGDVREDWPDKGVIAIPAQELVRPVIACQHVAECSTDEVLDAGKTVSLGRIPPPCAGQQIDLYRAGVRRVVRGVDAVAAIQLIAAPAAVQAVIAGPALQTLVAIGRIQPVRAASADQ